MRVKRKEGVGGKIDRREMSFPWTKSMNRGTRVFFFFFFFFSLLFLKRRIRREFDSFPFPRSLSNFLVENITGLSSDISWTKGDAEIRRRSREHPSLSLLRHHRRLLHTPLFPRIFLSLSLFLPPAHPHPSIHQRTSTSPASSSLSLGATDRGCLRGAPGPRGWFFPSCDGGVESAVEYA